jgi:para-aminobenzoate synthetase
MTIELENAAELASALLQEKKRPLVVALDGPSGSGKSTMAQALAERLDAAYIPLDDFFDGARPDPAWNTLSIQERRSNVFLWDRVIKECLRPLLQGRQARWRALDFEAGLQADLTYGLQASNKVQGPAALIILDGVYSAGPELEDYVDLRVLVQAPAPVRRLRLTNRDGSEFSGEWHLRWKLVEEFYFAELRPLKCFDFVISG